MYIMSQIKTTNIAYLRNMFILVYVCFFATFANAQTDNAQTDLFKQCRSIQDDSERLVCFDRALKAQTETQTREVKPKSSVSNEAENPSTTNGDMDEIDKRAQALMEKANSSKDPFSSSTPRLSPSTNRRSDIDNSFGSEQLGSDTAQDAEQIQTKIVSMSVDARGYATLTLSNDQIWRQTETARFTIKQDELVIIEKGMLGAYYLSNVNNNRQVRVKRIQ
jgi:hypothetical protein